MPWSEYTKSPKTANLGIPALIVGQKACRPNKPLERLWGVKGDDGYRLYIDQANGLIGICLDQSSPHKFSRKSFRMPTLRQALTELKWISTTSRSIAVKESKEPPQWVFKVIGK